MVPVGKRERKRLANEAKVLGVINSAAKAGEPCPRDMGIGDVVSLTRDQVKGAMRSLAKSGVIRIESKGGTRRITILATGAATGWTHPTPVLEANVPALVRMKTRGERLMDLILRKAEAGEEMPRGQQLADAIGSSSETATRDLRALERLGMIEIAKIGTKRRVTVVATGAQTAILSGDGRPRRVVRSHQKRAEEAREAYVEEAPAPIASLVPCARRGCEDAAARGRAYCGGHEMEVAA